MLEKIDSTHTLYAIYLEVLKGITIEVGKLGTYYFNEGTYIYVGSARQNIIARINRHKKSKKIKKWHFDYLRPYGHIIKIITYENSIEECQLAEKIRKEVAGVYPVRRFGSSDCRCTSHLIYME